MSATCQLGGLRTSKLFNCAKARQKHKVACNYVPVWRNVCAKQYYHLFEKLGSLKTGDWKNGLKKGDS